MLVDAHLDLAWNARRGLDPTLSLSELRARASGDIPTVTFEELRKADVGVVFATLFAEPSVDGGPGYTTPLEARREALAQLEVYQRWQDQGYIRLLGRAEDLTELEALRAREEFPPLGVVLLMEGADPLRDPDDLEFWVRQGLRLLGPAWGRTRYSGGTGAPGPLTDRGVDLLIGMRELNVTLDVSHLAEEAFWQATELQGKLLASHANARALAEGDRQLSDAMLGRVRDCGGVVGVVLYNRFLQGGWERGMPRLSLSAVERQLSHLAAQLGWERVALGSDLDGGFGRDQAPQGIESVADLPRLGELVPQEHATGLLGENWIRWLKANL
ncbi:membrane dipeptidase [Deinobacterium chartae]|uniref:Membrane dipeptidase n=1 Tax=Deinobacterium chartae TaxID=521158 RepID=A0A841HUZ9_9DEIO|nr:membrane dipeptidase [Deinobacterium chartae]MBB6096746.1 membrane dipeptidase [Deinobacterium chartae]